MENMREQMADKQPKILFYDIETSPALAWIWHTGKQWVGHDQLKDERKFDIICICYRWAHESKIHSLDWDYAKQDSAAMIEEFSYIVNQADLVIGHNADKFDMRHVNTQRLLHNQAPIAWPTTEDTLKQLRKYFYLPSYSLDYVSKLLTGSGKDKMSFQDWIDIVEKKNKKAFTKMIAYCKRDVQKLYEVWRKVSPHCQAKVHMGLLKGFTRESCPRCGHNRPELAGKRTLTTGRYQRYLCTICGHKWRDSRKD
jgi:uncharacterized protein YprB with RNaseH-like and TPR domain